MKYKVELHDDRRGLRINKRLTDDFSQIIFSIRPYVIWTRKGQIGHAKPAKKERKERDANVLVSVLQQTGPWELNSGRMSSEDSAPASDNDQHGQQDHQGSRGRDQTLDHGADAPTQAITEAFVEGKIPERPDWDEALSVWEQPVDHEELAANFEKIDAHDGHIVRQETTQDHDMRELVWPLVCKCGHDHGHHVHYRLYGYRECTSCACGQFRTPPVREGY